MSHKNTLDTINYLSLEILEFLGNLHPSEKQIHLVEEFLGSTWPKMKLTFSEKLSPREQSCLLLAAYGKSTEEISSILKIKPNTVATYRKEILRKLGCKTMAQAVFYGMGFGYIWQFQDKHTKNNYVRKPYY